MCRMTLDLFPVANIALGTDEVKCRQELKMLTALRQKNTTKCWNIFI